MVFPRMPSRMKQLSNHICLGIEPGEICSFVKIAIDAGKGEIFDIVTAAVNFGMMCSTWSAASGESS